MNELEERKKIKQKERDKIIQFVQNNVGTLVIKHPNKPAEYINAIPRNKDLLCGVICGYDNQDFNIIVGLDNSPYGFITSDFDADDILYEFHDTYIYISYEYYKNLIYGS